MKTCSQCGQAIGKDLLVGLCARCMATSMLGEWEDDLSEVSSAPDEFILTRVADYDVLRVLGRGGMGVVCRARDRLLGREVALKLLNSGVLASDEEIRRFRTEAEAVARLRHRNLVGVLEAGESDGQAYYTMPLAEGGTLAQRLTEGPLDARSAARYMADVGRAVAHAHARGVLHRDLKPANIVFDSEGAPMVSDFGLARFTGEDTVTLSGSLIGTPAYIAPEVASGEAGHTILSDLYALGVILFECLTGQTPFENDSPLALLKLITEGDIMAPSSLRHDLDRDLEAICLKALSKDPARRYASVDAFADDLEAWLRGDPVQARPAPITERFWRWAQRHQTRAVLYTMAAVSLMILVVVSAVSSVLLSAERSATENARRRSEVRLSQALQTLGTLQMAQADRLKEASSTFDEALTASAGESPTQHALFFTSRILSRLINERPLPRWQGGSVLDAWFDEQGIAHVRNGAETVGWHDGAWTTCTHTALPVDPPMPIDEGLISAKHPKQNWVATVDQINVLRVRDLSREELLTPAITLDFAPQRLVWSAKHDQLIVCGENQVVLYDW